MSESKKPKAVVLLSGGLDSATVLAIASKDYECIALSFDYRQRHRSELEAAKAIAADYGIRHQIIKLDDGVLGGSALTDKTIDVPDHIEPGIPVTYVPARNTVFLAHALAIAEVNHSVDIFIGVNAVDYSGYPDCRPAYIEAFEKMANLATRAGVEGHSLHIHTPLIDMSKAEIILAGTALGVDYSRTVSCYQADLQGKACGVCDSCRYRKKGFAEAGVEDVTPYQ
ncbi:MAG: 7-cyano-7-deazaguanine synthase QueC [Gammaproteobacteria bacterium]|nr:7-cyano-7-deazaguanine synthase QueC [Gammaproteobacteria bacterium]